MDVSVKDETIALTGQLDEHFPLEAFQAQLETLWKTKGLAKVSFASLKRANSTGLKLFLVSLDRTKIPVAYVDVPSWLVPTMNQIDEFFNWGCHVVNVKAPFFSNEGAKIVELDVRITDNFFETPFYKDIESTKDDAGNTLTPEFDPEEFFYFVQKMKKAA